MVEGVPALCGGLAPSPVAYWWGGRVKRKRDGFRVCGTLCDTGAAELCYLSPERNRLSKFLRAYNSRTKKKGFPSTSRRRRS